MAKSIVQHTDGDLFMRQRIDDGYINLNDIAKSTGKRVDVWLGINRTKELLIEFEKQNRAIEEEKDRAKIPPIGGNLNRAIEEEKDRAKIPIIATREKMAVRGRILILQFNLLSGVVLLLHCGSAE